MEVLLLLLIPLAGALSTTRRLPDNQEILTPGTTHPIPLWTQPSSEPTQASTTIIPVASTTLPPTYTPMILSTPTTTPTPSPPLGCPKCETGRCPRSSEECALGVGVVPDPCLCCKEGMCGLREGAKCFSDAVAHELLPTAKALGACGVQMECVLRTDLLATDNPEALCMCIDHSPVCGVDNRTYSTSCRLAQESDTVWVKYRGPCRAAPWLVSPPETELSVPIGGSVSFGCESKGYPTPRLHWERVEEATANNPETVVRSAWLPDDDPFVSVQIRGGPEPFMGSTWLQILEVSRRHAGSYICVAANSEGEVHAVGRLKVLVSSEYPER